MKETWHGSLEPDMQTYIHWTGLIHMKAFNFFSLKYFFLHPAASVSTDCSERSCLVPWRWSTSSNCIFYLVTETTTIHQQQQQQQQHLRLRPLPRESLLILIWMESLSLHWRKSMTAEVFLGRRCRSAGLPPLPFSSREQLNQCGLHRCGCWTICREYNT